MSSHSLKSETAELREVNSIVLDTFKHCDEMKVDLLEYSPDLRSDLIKFKENVEDLAELQKDLSALINTLESVDSEVTEDCQPTQIPQIFNRIHSSSLEDQYTNEQAERIIQAVDAYISDQNSGVGNADSDELLVTDTRDSYKDPLTKLPIQNPVKSKTCNHSFERNSIFNYLQNRNKCPYSGCRNILSREDIVEDLALKRKLLFMK